VILHEKRSRGWAKWVGGLVLLGYLMGATPGYAFLIQTYEGRRGKVQVAWPKADRGIPFVIHQDGSADLPAETVYRILRESFQIWEDVPTAHVRFIDQGLSATLTPSSSDRRNLLIFDRDGSWLEAPESSGIIAATLIQSSSFSGQITDADIVFNDKQFRFVSSGGSGTSINLKDVAVHEIGHFLGLDHSPLKGAALVRPTMNPFYSADGPGQSSSLEADDRTGLSVLYPTAEFLAATGSISGRVRNAEKQPLFGVHISAENLATGAFYSTLSGAYPEAESRGHYTLRGLPQGSYRIAIESIQEPVSEDNFGGIFHDLASGVQREYYRNTGAADQALPVFLAAGEEVSAVDFTSGLLPPVPTLIALQVPVNTPDVQGPYPIQVQVENAAQVVLSWRLEGGIEEQISMAAVERGLYEASLPGQALGTRIEYRLVARGEGDVQAFYPAASEWAEFEIISLSGAPLAFVALRGAGVLSAIDTGTQRELARIPVGEEPIQVLANQAGTRLYVSNLASNDVAVVEAASFRVLARIPVAAQPLDLAFSPDGSTLYVSNSGDASLSAISVDSHIVRTFRIGNLEGGPYGMAASGDYIYTTDIAGDQVLVLDDQGGVVKRIATPAAPRCLALNPEGTLLYVSSFRSNQLAVIGLPQHQVLSTIDLPVSATFAVAVAPNGKAFLSAHADAALVAVASRTGETASTFPVGTDPRGLAFSPDGKQLFVTSAGSGEISVFDLARGTIGASYVSGDNPRGIAVVEPVVGGSEIGKEEDLLVETVVRRDGSLPLQFALGPNFPNPFNAATRIGYRVPAMESVEGVVEITLYNTLGHKVRTLVRGAHPPGLYQLEWDGRGEAGREVASGVYVVMLRAPGFAEARRLLLVR